MPESYPSLTDPTIVGAEYAYLTTSGRNSGAPHTVELWFVAVGGACRFFTEESTDWMRNAIADPAVRVRVGGWVWEASVHVEPPQVASEFGAAARAAIRAKYEPGYTEPLGAWTEHASALVATVIEPPLPTIERWGDA